VDALALAHWHWHAERLLTLCVLTPAHRQILAMLALALADQDRVRAQWREQGYAATLTATRRDARTGVVTTRPIPNPLVHLTEQLRRDVRQLLSDCALTPVTSSKAIAHGEKIPDARARIARYVTPSG
jgi:phage terminase small subunit